MSSEPVIDSKTVGVVDGFDIAAHIVADDFGMQPDSGEFSDEEIDAWRADDWQYVATIVTASRAGIELGRTYLGGSQYGSFPGVAELVSPLNGSGDDFVNGYGPDLIAEAISEARATLARLAVVSE